MDEQLVAWFESGLAVPVLLGRARCFVPVAGAPGRHDRRRVVDELTRWASDHDRLPDAAQAFVSALQTAANDGDPIAAYDLVDCQIKTASALGGGLPVRVADMGSSLDHVDRYLSDPSPELAAVRERVRRVVPAGIAPVPPPDPSRPPVAAAPRARRWSPHTPPSALAQTLGVVFGLVFVASLSWVLVELAGLIGESSIRVGGRRRALGLVMVPILTAWLALGGLRAARGTSTVSKAARLWFWFLLLTIPNLFVAGLYSVL